ncbi:polycomb group protein Psc-like isoform X2 [Agrilus planipennis]|nr:polycomb group protein Psc-like isoform X2 [Agrilus planipennis]XP_018336920.1 polycomb group protein Psc-like isoform X2 [Agrilus planipennis]XP_025834131.1 polycomb group protein Psc-like isoform X2 [Agrilus planipennis]
MTMHLPKLAKPEKIRLVEINSHLTCYLCKGYFIDATTISECLHSFCRSCLIKFLQDNSHCPICEVLINKAKPNIKLDKTLQDIVYKLVPELFLNEMLRRQRFYQKHPEAAAKATPEDRGEDTERTIFSPRDSISLSIEYIREDSTPGAIAIPPSNCKNGTEGTKNGTVAIANDLESLALRRYLQCPGMCRVEVLKKFICTKYNVDINKFYIEILYKRVPLPDHYTLIDIAYIYSWKRNEPMKFFFKIIDLDTNMDVSEDVEISSFPMKINKPPKPKRKTLDKIKTTGDNKKLNFDSVNSDNAKCDNKIDKDTSVLPKTIITNNDNGIESSQKLDEKSENKIEDKLKPSTKLEIDLRCTEGIAKLDETKRKSDEIKIIRNGEDDSNKDKTTEEVKVVQNVQDDLKMDKTTKELKVVRNVQNDLIKLDSQKLSKEYTKITLNRNSNMEIITKVQQVSNKNGQPIGLKITKQLVKKPVIDSNKTINNKLTESKRKLSPKHNSIQNHKKNVLGIEDKVEINPSCDVKNHSPANDFTSPPESSSEPLEVDPEKSKFLESFELTARSSLSPQKRNSITNHKTTPESFSKDLEIQKCNLGGPSSAQKRKPSSPMKHERASKKQKSLAGKTSPNKRKPESKNISNPTVRQMVSNVHQSATNVSKIVEQSSPKSKCNKTDLQSLFDSCKINIPSSLSITIKEGTEDKNLPPVKPVKNYIEILKLPDTEQKLLKDSKELDDEYRERPKLNITVSCSTNGIQNVPKGDGEIQNKLPKTTEETTSTTNTSVLEKGTQNKPSATTKVVASTYIPEKVTTTIPIKLAPLIANQSFQKMFEESIKKSNWCISTDGVDKEEKSPKEDSKHKTSTISTNETSNNKLNEKESQKIALDLTTDSNSSNSSSSGLINSSTKKNILEIATQLYKKSKLEQTKSAEDSSKQNKTATNNTSTYSRHISATATPNYTPSSIPLRLTQTLSNLHSASLGLNYTVSVTQNNSPKLSPKISVPSPKRNGDTSKVPTTTSPTDSKVKTSSPKTGSTPKLNTVSPPFSLSPKSSVNSCANSSDKGVKTTIATGSAAGGLFTSGGFCIVSSKGDEPAAKVPRLSASPKSTCSSSTSDAIKISAASPKAKDSSGSVGGSGGVNSQKQSSSKNDSGSSNNNGGASTMNPNEILEKYNIQNLAQLTANFNFPINLAMLPHNQLAALHQAMILRHFELQNRQNWLNMNPSPLVQYEKYLQSLSQKQGQILSKEN